MANLQVGVAGNGTVTVGAGASVHSPASNTLTLGTNGDERLRLDSSGRLLVGTTASKASGSGQYGVLNVSGRIGSTTGEAFMSLSRGEVATTMSADDEVANITFNDLTGYEFARIQVLADAATGTTDTPGRIVFSTTADGASSATERLRITSGGDILFTGASTNAYWDQSTNRFTFEDNTMAAFGTSQDLAIYHSSSDNNSYIGNATGDIIIENSGGNTSNQIYIRGKTGVDSIRADGNGATYIYDQGSGSAILKISTNNTFGTILSNTTDDANYTNVLTLARRGYEASGYGVNFKAKGGSASGQNGLLLQVSQGSGGYSDRFTFDNDGLDLADGNLKVASGHGIDFSATSGSGTSELLDDYEEGTFSPRLAGSGNYGTVHAVGAGSYVKIGRLVHITCRFNNVNEPTMTGQIAVDALPFNVDDINSSYCTTRDFWTHRVAFNGDYQYAWTTSAAVNQFRGQWGASDAGWGDWLVGDWDYNGIYMNASFTYYTNS